MPCKADETETLRCENKSPVFGRKSGNSTATQLNTALIFVALDERY